MNSKLNFRLAFATSAALGGFLDDDQPLVDALKRMGVDVMACVWDDDTVRWAEYDAVVPRSIWDYFQKYQVFLAWLDHLDQIGVKTINDNKVLRGNSDKRYLMALAASGVDIIPTFVIDYNGLYKTIRQMDLQLIVVKPIVSGGAWHTVRIDKNDPSWPIALANLPTDLDYLVQPFIPELTHGGEWSLIFLDGTYSHAVIKRPAKGDYRVQQQFGGIAHPAQPDGDVIAAAARALGGDRPAYARVDGVVANGKFLLMELELIEPLLFLRTYPEAADRLARRLAGHG